VEQFKKRKKVQTEKFIKIKTIAYINQTKSKKSGSTSMFRSPLEQFDLVLLLGSYNGILELSFFHGMLVILFIAIFIRLIVYKLAPNSTLIPKGYQLLCEKIFYLIISIIKQQTGERGYIYFPFVFTIFIFILLSNLFSLLPFSFAITSHIINIFYLTLTLISGLFLLGCINFSFGFFKLFVPESPFMLLFLLIPIEIFSYVIRAFSMALRLSANIMAGHTLVFIVSGFLINLSTLILLLCGGVLLAIFFLEFGVAILQAYVFSVLFTIYLKDSLYEAAH
jgi:F-type H+-transporting ATPase subunit a